MLSATTFLAYLTLGFAALSSAVNGNPAAPSLTSRDIDLTNPQGIVLRPVDTVYTRDVLPRSNGERMKRGLAPLPPKRRHDRSHLQARSSQTPCTPVTGTIAATYNTAISGVVIDGWVAAAANSFGEYVFTSSNNAALHISICSNNNGPVNILTTNGVTTYPYFGVVAGYANQNNYLLSGSSNYGYIAATSQTNPNAFPANGPNAFSAASGVPENIESGIWNLQSGSNALTPTWINPDGSSATTHLIYVPSSAAFAVTGDVAVFSANFGDAYPATFTFVADV